VIKYLPLGDNPEEIYHAVKQNPESFLDSLFVQTAQTIVNMVASYKPDSRQLRVMAQTTVGEVRLEWKNHAHEGLTVWYKDIVLLYTAEAMRLQADGVVEVSNRSELQGFALTTTLENYILNVVVTYDTFAKFERWRKLQGH